MSFFRLFHIRIFPLPSRLSWLLVVIGFSCLALYWSVEDYLHWRYHPVLMTTSTVSNGLEKVPFPSIALCSQGFVSEIWEKILDKDKDMVENRTQLR